VVLTPGCVFVFSHTVQAARLRAYFGYLPTYVIVQYPAARTALQRSTLPTAPPRPAAPPPARPPCCRSRVLTRGHPVARLGPVW